MNVKVCVGSRCTMMGSNGMMDGLEVLQEKYFTQGELEIEPVNCMGQCKKNPTSAPVVSIDDEIITNATLQEVSERLLQKAHKID